MGNPLFRQNRQNDGNPISSIVNSLRAKGPSEAVFNSMYNGDPEFRKFADSVRGKTPEQAFGQYGLDFSKFRGFRW